MTPGSPTACELLDVYFPLGHLVLLCAKMGVVTKQAHSKLADDGSVTAKWATVDNADEVKFSYANRPGQDTYASADRDNVHVRNSR